MSIENEQKRWFRLERAWYARVTAENIAFFKAIRSGMRLPITVETERCYACVQGNVWAAHASGMGEVVAPCEACEGLGFIATARETP